jgi:hypothetical protein
VINPNIQQTLTNKYGSELSSHDEQCSDNEYEDDRGDNTVDRTMQTHNITLTKKYGIFQQPTRSTGNQKSQ